MAETKLCVDVNAMADIARRAGCKTNIEIADRMNSNRNTVGEVMSGKVRPSSDFMDKFVLAFNVNSELAGKVFFAYNLLTA